MQSYLQKLKFVNYENICTTGDFTHDGHFLCFKAMLAEKEETGRDYSEKENLQEACWNGLLPQMLPEIFQPVDKPVKLYLWNIKENKSGIEIDLAENPGEMEKDFSIDPYAFMDVQLMN